MFIWNWLVARFPWLAPAPPSLTLDEMIADAPELYHLVRGMRESQFFRSVPENELVQHIQAVAGAPVCGQELRDLLAQVHKDPCGGGIDTLKVRNKVFERINESAATEVVDTLA